MGAFRNKAFHPQPVEQCCRLLLTSIISLGKTPAKRRLLGTQFLKQRLGVLQVGGVEALDEPVVDFSEMRR
jgi:hypothetical protein